MTEETYTATGTDGTTVTVTVCRPDPGEIPTPAVEVGPGGRLTLSVPAGAVPPGTTEVTFATSNDADNQTGPGGELVDRGHGVATRAGGRYALTLDGVTAGESGRVWTGCKVGGVVRWGLDATPYLVPADGGA